MAPKQHSDNNRRVSLLSLPFAVFILVMLLALGIAFWRLGSVTEKDTNEYLQLMTDAESSHTAVQGAPYTAKQERQGIQKDMYFQKGTDRLHIQLISAQAQLVLDHQDMHTYVVEEMRQVKCWMQEELFYVLPDGKEAFLQPNGQLLLRASDEKNLQSWISLDTPGVQPRSIIRYIEADEALYHYKDDRFEAHQVKITRYSIPGHQLKAMNDQATLLMKGTAGEVEFSLKSKDKDLNFKAYHLKANFYDAGKINL